MSDDKRPKSEKFVEWFGPKSRNFLGSGVTLKEFMAVGYAEDFQRSWKQQHPKEKQRRLGYVTELSAEYERICALSVYGTAWIEGAIEAIIEGDLVRLRDMAMLAKRYGPEGSRDRVNDLIEAAIASWLEDGREEPEESN